jgi:putative ABC transport system ATP-binding protein
MAIELSNIRFHYSDQPDHTVLNIPFWSLADGEHVFIHGPSGCGKSTLLGLLSGLLTPSNGQVTVLGQRLDKMNSRQRDRFRATHIGYVFQQFNLIPYLNAIDNVLLATQFSKKKKTNALIPEIKTLFNALNISEKEWYKPTGELSVGQQQRVAIARALINKPQLLIADEPTSSLDAANRDAFMKLLMPIVTDNKMTLLFVSHDLSLSSYFNKVESLIDINLLEESE